MKTQKKDAAPAAIVFPKLVPGTLIRRYKRFLADVVTEDGHTVTAHCPNTGSMKGCSDPGRPVYLSASDNPKRKLAYTWELIDMPSSLVGINTGIPNRLVYQALCAGRIPEFSGCRNVRKEVAVAKGSRIDIGMEDRQGTPWFVEIKNCTMVEDGVAQFPDAVTARGRRHLDELVTLAAAGSRCAMFYLIQRTDAVRFSPAWRIDPAYSRGLAAAVAAGVQVVAYDVTIDLTQIALHRALPVRMGDN